MTYLFVQFAIYMIVAASIGFFAGWVIWGYRDETDDQSNPIRRAIESRALKARDMAAKLTRKKDTAS